VRNVSVNDFVRDGDLICQCGLLVSMQQVPGLVPTVRIHTEVNLLLYLQSLA
jgi:hypothetical protein